MKYLNSLLSASLAVVIAGNAHAAAPAQDVARLGKDLTMVGADKAGSADGAIPAYQGGLSTPPAGFKQGDTLRPDPYASEKPLLVIDGKNVDQYKDSLTATTVGWPSVSRPSTSTSTQATAPRPCPRCCWTTP